MGLLTDIVEEQHAKKRQEASTRLDAYRAIVSSPQATDDAKNYAIEQLLHTAGIKGKDHGPMAQMFGHMFGLGKGQQQGQGGPQQGQQQGGPVPAQPGPQAQAPDSLKGADYDPNTKQGTVPISELPLPNKPQAQASAPQQAQQQPQQQGMTPMPQQAGMSSMPQRPQKWFKTTDQMNDEEIRFEQKRQDILTASREKLEQEKQQGQQAIEQSKEIARVKNQKTTLRDIPKQSQDPQANPWDYVTIEHHGDGSESVLPGKRPALVEKTYQDAQSYSSTHPEVSTKQAYDMIMSGQVDLQQMRKANVQSTIQRREQLMGRTAATPIRGAAPKRASAGRAPSKAGQRTAELDQHESDAMAAAGADYDKALEAIKKEGPGGPHKYGALYGPLIDKVKSKVPKQSAKQGKEEQIRKMLTGNGKKAEAKPAQQSPQKVDVKPDTVIVNKKTGKRMKWDGKSWQPIPSQ